MARYPRARSACHKIRPVRHDPAASPPLDDEAFEWIANAPLADAHADSLLWNRDLSKACTAGHADIPRLLEGGIRAQAFTIATWGLPVIDGMGLLAHWCGWPRSARRSPRARALWQIEQIHRAVERSAGQASIVRTRADLDLCVSQNRLGAILGIEGAQCLEGDLNSLRELHALGVRFLGPAHLIPNEFASCSYWIYKDRGISGLGRELLAEMSQIGMGLDVAHASPRALDEMVTSPVNATFCSHTGVRAVTDLWRNLRDEQLRSLARKGGVAAVILAREYLGGAGIERPAAHVRHAVETVGAEYVAIGSDFDGFVRLPREMRDARDFRLLAPALRRAGLGREAVRAVLGGNLLRFWRRMLPQ
ncbi:MAG: membrane dipeptidase [Planctomycetes bacterium]|nr:membrane dipeptidase [Planctomycetota bacterium]